MEISRFNLLKGLKPSLKTCLRIALLGIPAILFGIVSEDNFIANNGWAVSSIALHFLVGLIASGKIFSSRIPLDLVEEQKS